MTVGRQCRRNVSTQWPWIVSVSWRNFSWIAAQCPRPRAMAFTSGLHVSTAEWQPWQPSRIAVHVESTRCPNTTNLELTPVCAPTYVTGLDVKLTIRRRTSGSTAPAYGCCVARGRGWSWARQSRSGRDAAGQKAHAADSALGRACLCCRCARRALPDCMRVILPDQQQQLPHV